MANLFRNILYVAPILHVLFSCMALGNPEIFNDTFAANSSVSTFIPTTLADNNTGILAKLIVRVT